MMNKWFTKYLFGVDNDIEEGPKAWIVREDSTNTNPTAYANYPNPDAEEVKLYLQGGAPGRGQLLLSQPAEQEQESLIDNYSFSGSSLAKAEYTEHRLLFVTPSLKNDLHLSGLPEVSIRLASSKPAANLSVWLVALPWEEGNNTKITDNIITRGWADPQNWESLSESEPLTPGKFYEFSFDLQPDDQIIEKGQQIGLMIFSSDREFTLWPHPGTELTVDLANTSITLPVVGGKEVVEKAFE